MRQGHRDHTVSWPYAWRALTPVQKGILTSHLIRRAHEARAHAIGKALLGWARYLRRRRRMRDLRELLAMDDMLLKDMGVSRSEVRGAVESGSDLKRPR
jgi:uncharacterized protein YjiS (DUF1127 family)